VSQLVIDSSILATRPRTLGERLLELLRSCPAHVVDAGAVEIVVLPKLVEVTGGAFTSLGKARTVISGIVTLQTSPMSKSWSIRKSELSESTRYGEVIEHRAVARNSRRTTTSRLH
jgi:hypothetical protein